MRIISLLCLLCVSPLFAAAPPSNPYLPSPLETRIIGPNSFLSGSTASLRIVTIDHLKEMPIESAAVRVDIYRVEKDGSVASQGRSLFNGKTNRRGTVDASFRIPKLATGPYQLKVTATSSATGQDVVTQQVNLVEKAQLLITTDKPVYQPAQLIHIRSLAMARPDNKPVAKESITFEVEDPKGNKVFKETKETSAFGIAGSEFELGHEISLGRYTVRAILGDTREERKITVERYVLPKFKVTASTEKSFYQPGETVSGKIKAEYFFGKPVSASNVTINVSTFDVGVRQIARLEGKTDGNGSWSFETTLPAQLVGQPVQQGNASVVFEVVVKDKAQHEEKTSLSVPVSQDKIRITVIPESGKVIPQVENRFFVLTSYPDGTPVPCRIRWSGKGYEYAGNTDALGIAEVPITPRGTVVKTALLGGPGAGPIPNVGRRGRRGGFGGPGAGNVNEGGEEVGSTETLQFKIIALDEKGNRTESEQNFSYEQRDESVLVRTNKSIAGVGDDLQILVLASRPQGTAYVDIIRDGQTVLTKSVDFQQGRGPARVSLDPSLSGTLVVHAYMITTKGDIVRDQKVVYVNAANDLNVKVMPDKETYRPGGKAKITFAVTDKSKNPIAAALGINIVDESVFALQEMQPGMERIYFTLERELLKPRYEVHEFTLNEVLAPEWTGQSSTVAGGPPRDADRRQKAARILFAASAPSVSTGINVNTYSQKVQAVMPKWLEAVQRDGRAIWNAAKKYHDKTNSWLSDRDIMLPGENSQLTPANLAANVLVRERLLEERQLMDPLGIPYRISTQPFGTQDVQNGFVIKAAGPDRRFDTLDDVLVYVYQGGETQGLEFGVRDGDVGLRFMRRGGAGLGGFGGGLPGEVEAAPMMAERLKNGVDRLDLSASKPANGGGEEAVRIRQFFPETLASIPELITDDKGRASMELSMADSITTWRLSALASAMGGELGSITSPVRVFQDFFVDIDLPVSLTQNDEVSIPVAIYNYLEQEQRIILEMEPGDWFQVNGEARREISLGKGEVSVVYFPIKVKGIGNHTLTVTARGSALSDAIKRSIEVMPDGQENWQNVNDRLEPGTVERTVAIPTEAIENASNILVRIYPGGFSEVVDGLDKILRMPFG